MCYYLITSGDESIKLRIVQNTDLIYDKNDLPYIWFLDSSLDQYLPKTVCAAPKPITKTVNTIWYEELSALTNTLASLVCSVLQNNYTKMETRNKHIRNKKTSTKYKTDTLNFRQRGIGYSIRWEHS